MKYEIVGKKSLVFYIMSTGIAIIYINTMNIISESYKPIRRWCKKKTTYNEYCY